MRKKLLILLICISMMLTLTACRFGGKTIIQSGRDIYKYSADDDYDDSDDKREKPGRNQINIEYSEASKIEFADYTDSMGWFTASLPKGWSVQIGLPPSDLIDVISYAIKIYKTDNPDICAYVNLNCTGMLKSDEAYEWYNTYYPSDMSKDMIVVSPENTKGFFKSMGDIYGYSKFNVTENLGRSQTGGDVLDATCISKKSGDSLRGIFSAYISSYEYPVQRNMFNYAAGTIDVGMITAYSVYYMTAPENEFLTWQPILEKCISSIKFTDKFNKERKAMWAQVMGNSAYISQTANGISDMIMDSWEKRNTSQDIISQKQSDATLGYERVYNTETMETFEAYNGFLDDYKGDLYKPATDEMYLQGIDGYIQK